MCKHERWHYCRITLPKGAYFLSAQCLDCQELIKLDRHDKKLYLSIKDLPENAPIHPFYDGGVK